MQDQSTADHEHEPSGVRGYISESARDIYKKWNTLFAIKPEDSAWLKAGKVIVRLVILLLLVALSPLIMVGLLFALIAAL